MQKAEILTKIKSLITIADELEEAGVLMHSDARDLRAVARVLRDSVIFEPVEIVLPLCPACGGEMADFDDDGEDQSARHTPPRFICKNKECWKKLIGKAGKGVWKEDQFEDSKFRTGLWNVRDLKNSKEYHEAEIAGKTKRIQDVWQNRDKFR